MGYLGIPQNRDDGKRAFSAIEVAFQGASPLWKGVWGKPLEQRSRDLGEFGYSVLISAPYHLDMLDLYLCFDVHLKILICSTDLF